jgi:Uma2 family endonuclease
MPQAAIRLWTADDFFALGQVDERAELVRGEVVAMTPAGGEHGVVALRMGARLLAFVEAHDLGVVCAAETGFLISRDPDTLRAPDAAFVSRERMGTVRPPKKFWPFAPDLAVEVVSPSDRAEEVERRVRDWFSGGALRVWVLYPGLGTVHVHRSSRDVTLLSRGDILTGDETLAGFGCPVADLFA